MEKLVSTFVISLNQLMMGQYLATEFIISFSLLTSIHLFQMSYRLHWRKVHREAAQRHQYVSPTTWIELLYIRAVDEILLLIFLKSWTQSSVWTRLSMKGAFVNCYLCTYTYFLWQREIQNELYICKLFCTTVEIEVGFWKQ